MQIVGAFVIWFIVWFLISCFSSACVMLGVGNMHEWWSFIPTMGFWEAFSITIWFAIPLGLYSGYNSSRSE